MDLTQECAMFLVTRRSPHFGQSHSGLNLLADIWQRNGSARVARLGR